MGKGKKSVPADETIMDVLNDIDALFSWKPNSSPSKRCEAYIEERGLRKEFKETILQCAIRDLAHRAYACNRDGSSIDPMRVSELDRALTDFIDLFDETFDTGN